jgi:stage II sporulation protein D
MRGRVVLAVAVAAGLVLPAPAFAGALFLIRGAGWGNGLGLSQWGAEGFAVHGWDYRRILAHYYPHTTLTTASQPPVRVLVAVKQPSVRIGSTAPFLIVDARSHKVHVHAGTIRLGPRLRAGGRVLAPPILVEPGAQPLSVGGTSYRGTLTLSRADGGLSVLNTLPLELYLRGVVPSEMPEHWLLQAYEAQAVAARSFVLASLDPNAPFDVYADSRSQVYGGIAAESAVTNDAVGTTTGQVLTYEGRVVTAYYDSDSGGRTASVEDVFAGSAPRPYLVSVTDPYDSSSPYRHWRLATTADELSARLGTHVDDVRVEHGGSGVATRVAVFGAGARKLLAAGDFSRALNLRSLRFSISVLSLDRSTAAEPAGTVTLHGFLRDIAGVVLQQQRPDGSWHQVARVHARADGRFSVAVRPRFATAYRLAVDRVAGPALEVAAAKRRNF